MRVRAQGVGWVGVGVGHEDCEDGGVVTRETESV